ncbi:hypothetical protein MDAP_000982 [Mitosporidium daphniae]|uniref:BZIP domain-containing protein n=1 Tax=Mitosporidium daphniae TaxID=1485682 RepID=A0A098VMY9_9MICR|nr:uncharacterized protein DI09_72p70 [Mitosporidium daphniae]KGG50388.1 hypothetical protein DI09_72p70 [Mitosporidium daphniae]|eukprot:XP_013236831.1 uncharacterized protein DI09_72p70 [Mitosporidium daphniae]
MRGLILQLSALSQEVSQAEHEDTMAHQQDFGTQLPEKKTRPLQNENTVANIDPMEHLSKKELVMLLDKSGEFFNHQDEDSLKSIQSMFALHHVENDGEINHSTPTSICNKAEKNRLAQKAYRKRKAEYIKILEARSSLLSILESELKEIQDQLSRVNSNLFECYKERDLLLEELNALKREKKCKACYCKGHKYCFKDKCPGKKNSDTSNGSSGDSSDRSFEYSPYLDGDFCAP